MKRYVATIDFYIFAKTNKDAAKQLKKVLDMINKEWDANASPIALHKQISNMEFKQIDIDL